jgi:DeoR/GlpR family transcriptional regulator of sugar metabolism
VAVDNYQAGLALGRWAGQYALQHWDGRANVLDLTYHLDNTRKRSQGFSDGLLEVNPQGRILLSIDAQHETAIAHQFTLDALSTYPEINIIYGVTYTMAWGALTACQKLNLDPQQITVIPFGLEGNLLRDALAEGQFCKAGLAMFPELVAPVCIEAAIAAANHQSLPETLETPFVILTTATLTDFYVRGDQEWKLQWPVVNQRLKLPLTLCPEREHAGTKLPRRIGFIVPFSDHEWYINLIQAMRVYTSGLGIHLVIVDAEANLREEWAMRQRAIARAAAACIKPGEVVMIDSGPITQLLAEELLTATNITVITNSISIFDVLKSNPGITLISTGGVLRGSTQLLVGPTAKNALRELRADKLFLTTTGITLDFGLSHTNISEVTVKQAMIHSAREVILLADHSCFDQESIIQFAPVSAVNQVISDDAMPTSTRLEFSQQGIQITLAAI